MKKENKWESQFAERLGEYAQHERLHDISFSAWAIAFISSLLEAERERILREMPKECNCMTNAIAKCERNQALAEVRAIITKEKVDEVCEYCEELQGECQCEEALITKEQKP